MRETLSREVHRGWQCVHGQWLWRVHAYSSGGCVVYLATAIMVHLSQQLLNLCFFHADPKKLEGSTQLVRVNGAGPILVLQAWHT